ncbi:monocarboxylate transporter 12-like [Scyliorhinus canicula]|uniref:monocarboxylate transporter 12-like n=1 Tax=Scyliorhinus canicula TaxID=7830 RepID=UPI0018F4CCCB|nr:monocarboxylate transporter 12-like [Scyliorhinus canicula]
MKEHQKRLQNKVENLENRSHRQNLRIVGIPEGCEGTDASAYVANMLEKLMGEGSFSSPLEVDRAHRMLARLPRANEPPRAMVVRMHRFLEKEQILHWAKQTRSYSKETAMSKEPGAADSTAEEPSNSTRSPKYTDGGYGWVILASCFVITGLSTSFVKSFGIFFRDIQEYFDELAFKVSWISSITVAVFHAGCLGNGFAWLPSVSLVTQYFRERRPLANAIASCGECVFTFIFTPFYQWLVDQMSWRQTMMIIAGIQLNLCVCGALMRPYQPQKKYLTFTPSSASTSRKDLSRTSPDRKKNLAHFFDLPLLKQPKFICMVFFGFFSAMGFFIPDMYLIPHAQNIGIEHFQAALLMSYWSAGDCIGRLSCGWLANFRLVKSIRLTAILITILSIALMLFPVAKSYTLLVIFSCICGFFFGTMLAIIVTVLTDVMGVEKLDNALGLIMFFRSIACLFGPPLAGLLVDTSGDYSSGFYVGGGGLFIAVCFLMLADYFLDHEPNFNQDTEKEMEKFISQCQPQEEAEKGKLGTDRTNGTESEVSE